MNSNNGRLYIGTAGYQYDHWRKVFYPSELRKKGFTRLILGGPDERLRGRMKNHLHSYLQQRLAGEFAASPDDKDPQLREKVLEAARAHERAREKELIRELFEKSGPGGLSVLGTDPVIQALRKGQVHTLVLGGHFTKSGFLCPRDHLLSTYEETCPLCGGAMEKTDDLVAEMVASALAQDAEIEHIFEGHEAFEKYRAGALLRFSLQPAG